MNITRIKSVLRTLIYTRISDYILNHVLSCYKRIDSLFDLVVHIITPSVTDKYKAAMYN